MKIACLSFTEKGKEIGDRLKNLNKDDGKYLLTHYANGEVEDKI